MIAIQWIVGLLLLAAIANLLGRGKSDSALTKIRDGALLGVVLIVILLGVAYGIAHLLD